MAGCLCYYDSVHVNREESRLKCCRINELQSFSGYGGFGTAGHIKTTKKCHFLESFIVGMTGKVAAPI